MALPTQGIDSVTKGVDWDRTETETSRLIFRAGAQRNQLDITVLNGSVSISSQEAER